MGSRPMVEKGSSPFGDLSTEEWGNMHEVFGLDLDYQGPGQVILRLPQARPEQRGGGGTSALNGGVIAYMFDMGLGAAIGSQVLENAKAQGINMTRLSQVTINLSISYLKSAFGDSFETHAKALQVGKNIAFAEGQLYDEKGALCATAHGIWRIFWPKEE